VGWCFSSPRQNRPPDRSARVGAEKLSGGASPPAGHCAEDSVTGDEEDTKKHRSIYDRETGWGILTLPTRYDVHCPTTVFDSETTKCPAPPDNPENY